MPSAVVVVDVVSVYSVAAVVFDTARRSRLQRSGCAEGDLYIDVYTQGLRTERRVRVGGGRRTRNTGAREK